MHMFLVFIILFAVYDVLDLRNILDLVLGLLGHLQVLFLGFFFFVNGCFLVLDFVNFFLTGFHSENNDSIFFTPVLTASKDAIW